MIKTAQQGLIVENILPFLSERPYFKTMITIINGRKTFKFHLFLETFFQMSAVYLVPLLLLDCPEANERKF